jgi:hypothetical protein
MTWCHRRVGGEGLGVRNGSAAPDDDETVVHRTLRLPLQMHRRVEAVASRRRSTVGVLVHAWVDAGLEAAEDSPPSREARWAAAHQQLVTLRASRNLVDEDPGDVSDIYQHVEGALASEQGRALTSVEVSSIRRIIDLAGRLMAARFRAQGRAQADNAITWGTSCVGCANQLDDLAAEYFAGQRFGERRIADLIDEAFALLDELVPAVGEASGPGQLALTPTQREDLTARVARLRARREDVLIDEEIPDDSGGDG